ncbi:hypothetical protein PV433_16940 [Paenibacillus sp. GYB004]|uniref:hypothetical protein n=1 Tax=Paenibacillus sp. GYB004 TaxID=2994393 RepID=UPI002F965542
MNFRLNTRLWLESLGWVFLIFSRGFIYVIPRLKSVVVLTANSDAAITDMQAATNPVIKDPAWILRRFLMESTASALF